MLSFCCLLKFLKSTGAERCGGVLFSLSFSAIQHPSPEWSGGDRLGGGVEDSLAKTKWFKAVESVQEGSADNKISAKEFLKKNSNCQFLGRKTSLFSSNLTKKTTLKP